VGIGQKLSNTKKNVSEIRGRNEGQNNRPTGNLLFDNKIYDYGSNTATVEVKKHIRQYSELQQAYSL
jgi:late competence protein required for DNA uptake (superfamily II DNA/RNA helicase)